MMLFQNLNNKYYNRLNNSLNNSLKILYITII